MATEPTRLNLLTFQVVASFAALVTVFMAFSSAKDILSHYFAQDMFYNLKRGNAEVGSTFKPVIFLLAAYYLWQKLAIAYSFKMVPAYLTSGLKPTGGWWARNTAGHFKQMQALWLVWLPQQTGLARNKALHWLSVFVAWGLMFKVRQVAGKNYQDIPNEVQLGLAIFHLLFVCLLAFATFNLIRHIMNVIRSDNREAGVGQVQSPIAPQAHVQSASMVNNPVERAKTVYTQDPVLWRRKR